MKDKPQMKRDIINPENIKISDFKNYRIMVSESQQWKI